MLMSLMRMRLDASRPRSPSSSSAAPAAASFSGAGGGTAPILTASTNDALRLKVPPRPLTGVPERPLLLPAGLFRRSRVRWKSSWL